MIYYVEDDEQIGETIREYLEQKNYSVTIFRTISEAKQGLLSRLPVLLLLDWELPDGDGRLFCQWVRKRWRELPMIFLTVRRDSGDIVSGLQTGADDYLTKPFELEVLYVRIQALLRRVSPLDEAVLSCGEIVLDKNRRRVFQSNTEIQLSQPEYQILEILMENKGKIITREQLLEKVWDSRGIYVNDNTLTVTMKRLREKLGQPSLIKTIRSFGYCMEETL